VQATHLRRLSARIRPGGPPTVRAVSVDRAGQLGGFPRSGGERHGAPSGNADDHATPWPPAQVDLLSVPANGAGPESS
jgi:hypothetical protein